MYPPRHHYEEQMAAEQNEDDVDTVRYAKKRRYLEGSTHLKIRGRSCTGTEWLNFFFFFLIYTAECEDVSLFSINSNHMTNYPAWLRNIFHL